MELKAGIYLFSLIDKIFYDIYDRYVHENNEEYDHCFISIVSYKYTYHLYMSFLTLVTRLAEVFIYIAIINPYIIAQKGNLFMSPYNSTNNLVV